MRMLMHVKLPNEPFNTAERKGTVGETIRANRRRDETGSGLLHRIRGSAWRNSRRRCCRRLKDSRLAEPWFLSFNANVEFHAVMSPEELGKAGLDTIGKKWPAVG